MKTTKTIKSGEHQTTIKRMDWTIRVYSCEAHRHATRCAWSDGLNTYVQFGGSFWMVSTYDNTLIVEYAEVTETTEAEQVTEVTETTEGKTFAQEWRERIVESLPTIHFIKDNRTRPALAAADLQAGMTVYATGNCVDSIITSVELSKTGKSVTISDRTCGGRTRTYRKNAESIVELANDTREKYRRLAEMAERVKATAEAETVTESEPVAEIEAEATAPEATTESVEAEAYEATKPETFEEAKARRLAEWGAELDSVNATIAALEGTPTEGMNEFIHNDSELRKFRARRDQLEAVIASFAPEATETLTTTTEATTTTTQQVAADAAKQPTKSVKAITTTDDADHWRKVGEATAEGRITTFATMDEATRWVGCYIDGELDGVDDEASSYDFDCHAIAEAITCERCGMLALLPIYDELSDQFEYATLWQVIESHRNGDDDPTDPTDGTTYTTDEAEQPIDDATTTTTGDEAWRAAFALQFCGYWGRHTGTDKSHDVPCVEAYPESARAILGRMVNSDDETVSAGARVLLDSLDAHVVTTTDEPYAPIGWLDRGDETLDVWATTERGTYRVTAELDRLDVLDTIHADSDEEAIASAAEAFGACGFCVINGEQMAYLTGAEFDERIITHDEMAEAIHALGLDGASALRVGLMRNSVVYFMGQLRDSALDEATRERYRVTMSAVTCALDCLAHDIERGERATESTDEPTATDHASDRVNVATRIMALWDEFEPYTYRDALLEEDGDACALRALIAADPGQMRGLLDEVLDEGTTEQATRALTIIDAIDRLDADEGGDSATVMVDEAGEVVDDGGALVDAEGNIADERDDGVTDEVREVLDLLEAMRDEYQAQEARCEAEGNGMFAFTYHAQAYAIDSAISRIMTRLVA